MSDTWKPNVDTQHSGSTTLSVSGSCPRAALALLVDIRGSTRAHLEATTIRARLLSRDCIVSEKIQGHRDGIGFT